MKIQRILAIEDEADILEVIAVNLKVEGYEVISASDGRAGLGLVKTQLPDLVLLDLLLPGLSGLEVCREIRVYPATQNTPIIMLTCKGRETDKVIGLGMGADDYITKPFGVDELVARVRAVLRRASMRSPGDVIPRITKDDLVLDAERHEVMVKGELVSLTATEFKLLHILMSHPGRVFTRENLISQAIGEDAEILERNIDVHVGSLRSKLGTCGRLIETVRGVGYRFSD